MEVHLVTLYIVDHDKLEANGVKDVLENTKYPNRCMYPEVLDVKTKDIGEWHDDHPLNMVKGADEFCRELFKK